MDKLKICFVDFWPEFEQLEDFITPILSKHFDIVIDNKNPDVLFHSIFNGMRSTPTYKCKKILILAENWRVSQFKSDYSVSFDPHTDTNYRLPLWQMYLLLKPELKERLFARKIVNEFERFCAFTVSNPSNNLRISHYELLSTYKKVNAYGKVKMNSYELKRLSEGKYWRDAKDEFFLKHPHKFMMTYENSSHPYYCTEKLMDAFLSGSISIYWGDPKVEEDWNDKAFINVMNTNWFERVKLIDNNNEEFLKIYNEPVFTNEQKEIHLHNINNFEDWLINKVKS